uniref:Uncharacterized protein n=1 Tax=Hippocampus comes TaxID=109280 RepID=A0A3Q2YKJ0_HIPCM
SFLRHPWLSPFLHLGHKQRLEAGDLYTILPEDESEVLGQDLQRCWELEVKRATKQLRKPTLTKVLIKCYGKSFAVAGIFAFSLVCTETPFFFFIDVEMTRNWIPRLWLLHLSA